MACKPFTISVRRRSGSNTYFLARILTTTIKWQNMDLDRDKLFVAGEQFSAVHTGICMSNIFPKPN